MAKPTIAELQVKINNLEYEIKNQNEIMYDKGIKTRKTMMSDIEKVESEARNTINYIIKDCEKKTGRKLKNIPFFIGLDFGKTEKSVPLFSRPKTWQEELQAILKLSYEKSWRKRELQACIKKIINTY